MTDTNDEYDGSSHAVSHTAATMIHGNSDGDAGLDHFPEPGRSAYSDNAIHAAHPTDATDLAGTALTPLPLETPENTA